uniref:Uncharacterized protein n=1 Tax=Aplanochytrium stocchinoi TaxID=215587 RepID=A0A7S3LIK7_9STRA|mmetsp:Transcript_12671/g.16471  ORF Transcript_12671/g.16471 Transcript_12671/m.16471 type:complete len:603 (+) Transcript_12671:79-1887(+)|eukprot:CAMPEP_0204863284 /NCGR_PEP_ID=MMETSP1348-20121228/3202_1 /ASSEMBLY_ACC=CAM_ASM_000700 /TAXON_ID=215587 /ORGANISM="Aplanochytrium stocchinoi, Strain GSBS06" /LENGTH=602 /DNA_ID=CAMNT_0052013573 /DNA_START=58 /DNA_END=1866 /DNA_ORIENTATION=-
MGLSLLHQKYAALVTLLLLFWVIVNFLSTVGRANSHVGSLTGSKLDLEDARYRYYIVCDAGSTGTRLYVYYMQNDFENVVNEHADDSGEDTLTLKYYRGDKVKPGLSSFAGNPQGLIPYLKPLFDHAVDFIPEDALPFTQAFIRATAGMRLLEKEEEETIYDVIYETFPTLGYPFSLPRSHISTISGQDEGYYALIAVNYLMGRISDDFSQVASKLFGALDIGGSSTQIMFDPTVQYVKSNLRLRGRISDTEVEYLLEEDAEEGEEKANNPVNFGYVSRDRFYTHSFLSYGAERMRERLDALVVERSEGEERSSKDDGDIIHHPCYFKGYKTITDGQIVTGSGQADECFALLTDLIFGGDAKGCLKPMKPCKINGVKIPEIVGEFLGMSAYYYAIDCMRVFLVHTLNSEHKESLQSHEEIIQLENEWPQPSIDIIRAASNVFCSLPWEYLRDHLDGLHPVTPQRKLPHRCFDVSLVTSLLAAYGFNTKKRDITFALNIKDIDIEWTIGAFLEERMKLMQQQPVTFISNNVHPPSVTYTSDGSSTTTDGKENHLKVSYSLFGQTLLVVIAFIAACYAAFKFYKRKYAFSVQSKRKFSEIGLVP